MSWKNYFFISCLFAKIRSEVSIIVEAYFYTIVGRKSELVITHSWRRHTYAQLPIVRISDWFSFECQLIGNSYPNQFLVLWFFIQVFTMNPKIYKCILSTGTPCIYQWSWRHELIVLTLVSATFVSAEMSALCVAQRDSHGVRETCVARLLSG